MKKYMMLRSGDNKVWIQMSADEKQRLMEKYFAYVNKLKREERLMDGANLKESSMQFRSEKGVVVIDGPFLETKETMNGYLIFEAKDQGEAEAIARECPALTHGEKVQLLELAGN